MNKLTKLVCVSLLIIGCFSNAYADEIRGSGSTSNCVDVKILDSTVSTGAGKPGLAFNTAGFNCYYHRSSAATSTLISKVLGTVGTFVSSGFVPVDNTNQPGIYQLCPPNAAFIAGASYVDITCQGSTDVAQMDLRILLSPTVNVGSTSPSSITEDAFAPTNLFGSGSTTTVLQLAAGETSNDISGQSICASSGIASKTCRPIVYPGGYNTTTKAATVSPPFTNAPTSGDGYSIGNFISSSGPTLQQIVEGVYNVKTAQSVTTAAIVLANTETYGDDALINNNAIWIYSSTNGMGQVACIKKYVASSKAATFIAPLKILPTGTVRYSVVQSASCNPALYPKSN